MSFLICVLSAMHITPAVAGLKQIINKGLDHSSCLPFPLAALLALHRRWASHRRGCLLLLQPLGSAPPHVGRLFLTNATTSYLLLSSGLNTRGITLTLVKYNLWRWMGGLAFLINPRSPPIQRCGLQSTFISRVHFLEVYSSSINAKTCSA